MKKDSIKLSNLQISVMKVLWAHDKLSVSDTHKKLNASQKKPMALTTVATVLKRMHEKDLVGFEKAVKSSMLGNMVNHLFNNEPSQLVHHLVDNEQVSAEELALIKSILSRSKK